MKNQKSKEEEEEEEEAENGSKCATGSLCHYDGA